MSDRLIHAGVLLEVFDAASGRKVDESGGENYITPLGLEYARWSTRQAYAKGMPGVGALDLSPPDKFSFVYMTDSDEPTDIADSHPEGVMTAWAGKGTSAGSNVLAGAANGAECESSPASAKWVFDWATDRAVGVHRSVGWGYSVGSGYGFGVDDFTNFGGNHQYASMNVPGGGVFRGTTSTTQPSLLDPVTMASLGAWGPTASQLAMNGHGGAAHDGTDMFVTDYTNRLYFARFTLPSGPGAVSVTNVTVSGAVTGLQGLAYDGSYLWACDSGGTRMIRFDKASGAIERSFTLLNPAQNGPRFTYNAERNTLLIPCLQASPSSGVIDEYNLDGEMVGRFNPMSTIYSIHHVSGLTYLISGYQPNSTRYCRSAISVGSRILLPSPVTKSSLQTMKLTYTFTYT